MGSGGDLHRTAGGGGQDLEARLLEGAARLGVAVTQGQARQLLAYQELLLAAAGRLNLTAVHDAAEALEKHILDSISLFRVLDGRDEADVIDVGSGGGLPGIPVKIMRPRWHVCLLDSSAKKVQVMAGMCAALQLQGIQALHGRAEELARRESFRDSMDVAVARAVAPMAVLLELCLPFVRPGGVMVAMKGPAVEEELPTARRALSLLAGEVAARDSFRLPFSGARRELVVIRKIGPTDQKYPRRPGVPSRRPL